MTSIFLLVLLYAFPVTHLYVMEDGNEELLSNSDLQFDNTNHKDSSTLDSKGRENVFKADLESLDKTLDEADDYDEDPWKTKKEKTSLTISGDVKTTKNHKYHISATFTPAKNPGYDASASCTPDGNKKIRVRANFKAVKTQGPKLLYKLSIVLKSANKKAMESVVANCLVKTNNGKLLELKLNLNRLSQHERRRKIIKKNVQLEEEQQDKDMPYNPRQIAELIGEGL